MCPDVGLCYIDVPTEPYLVAITNNTVVQNWAHHLEEGNEEIECETNDKVILHKLASQLLDSESHLVELVNNIFLINDPQNEKVYERLDMSSEEIFTITKQYTSLYQDGNTRSFAQFAKKCDAKYLDAQVSKKTQQRWSS
ncbi:hypothetical protein BCV72DRAFT_322959 [Rhizopus microsporus var. microsporus]|uniref:Uncharacterized protein n=2 Tax=Rhizopus microsporus TaxID=58291 RepID=A0A2G4SXJ4_RHIZD|nr:uncharacterized protein RHIMIDRAFT_250655 [Rhizopus microsporus ATCC 52813]ORE01130.1 hypothetical protein BCV72DRAFT_322959 [Rhizopus microsporus var. microsporus]PHZ13465.1 hypothetical protein RHIMIDRAFT_250655 [Rhizopus microsporus ATCC 52813]